MPLVGVDRREVKIETLICTNMGDTAIISRLFLIGPPTIMEYDLETDTWTDLGVPITGGQTQYYTVGYY